MKPDLTYVPPFPPEMETVEYWEEVVASAVADWTLGQMEMGKIPPVGWASEI